MRPTQALAEVRKLFRKPSQTARELAVLGPLPRFSNQRRGGLVPKRSEKGVFHGAVISTGNNINTNNKDHTFYSSRKFKPNVAHVTHTSQVLGAEFKMPTTARALKQIKRHGSFDNYLLNVHPSLLSTETTRLRDAIRATLHAYLDVTRSALSPLPPSPSSSSSTDIALPEEEDALDLGEELELPRGIVSRPHALDRVRPRAFKLGDEIRLRQRQKDGLVKEDENAGTAVV